MKKIKSLYFILLLIFLCRGVNVYAAEELTCIYEGTFNKEAIMLTQNSTGEISLYYNYKVKKPKINDKNWYKAGSGGEEVKYKINSKHYKNNELTNCPAYTRTNIFTGTTHFYDKKGALTADYELIKKHDRLPGEENYGQTFSSDKDYSDEIKNTNWIGICEYESVILYFNTEKYILNNKSSLIYISTGKFNLNQLLENYTVTKACPFRLYKKTDQTVVSVGNTFSNVSYYLTNEKGLYEMNLLNGKINYTDDNVTNDEKEEKCLGLFSDRFIEKLNSYLSFIRIIIPIILIVMGAIDCVKAIFSSSEEEVKKVQKKFLKRVIAAIIVFFIPVLVNLLLKTANSVWDFIDPNSCNIG